MIHKGNPNHHFNTLDGIGFGLTKHLHFLRCGTSGFPTKKTLLQLTSDHLPTKHATSGPNTLYKHACMVVVTKREEKCSYAHF